VEASNAFGCSHADAIFVTVFDCTTGLEEAESQKLSAYPNPVTDDGGWTIQGATPHTEWSGDWVLMDDAGRVVQTGRASTFGQEMKLEVSAQGLAKGSYLWVARGTDTAVRLQCN
jgi:hypothetical protein